jgi:predicted MFS family arabinose efflux permease
MRRQGLSITVFGLSAQVSIPSSTTTADSSNNLGLIIGIAAGSCIGGIILIVIAISMWRKYNVSVYDE